MLSKLRHAGIAADPFFVNKKTLTDNLHSLFAGELIDLLPIGGGTLGICFVGMLYGQRRVFKTHLALSGNQTLEREAAFLNAVGGFRTDTQLIHGAIQDQVRVWLHMKELRQSDALTPLGVRKLISDYVSKLQACPHTHRVPQTDDIGLLLSEAETGLGLLANAHLISVDVQRQARHCLDRVRSNCDSWPRQLCHGDLGPANILADELGPLAIDWEDAFWGVAGYDYLYWLTFFNNRPWLSRDALGHTPLGKANEVALMVMILVLKSVLSLRNGSYRRNSISFDQRLLEVIGLD